ncbi:glycosyltransferase [Blastococcus sp. URHD0036]|uniref:glycosyltransferase n=1 Tax=Blastococcus sp. URHD0036 TaxID=1380356 RepID=UPI00068D8DC8|nr:glycosyltransferase [Blastococcus sp. URHD0036]
MENDSHVAEVALTELLDLGSEDFLVDRGDPPTLDLRGHSALLVASTGGHLSELYRLAAVMAPEDSSWVTFDTPQSRSVLRGERVTVVPYVGPRDLRGSLAAMTTLWRVLRLERPDVVVSTGAAVAISAFLAARLLGIPCVYVESLARMQGPSLTGRIVAALRLGRLYTQHASWATGVWQPYRNVLADFLALPLEAGRRTETRPRLFVTLGTIRPYRFDALVDAVLASGLADERTVWQLGSTTRDDLPGRTFASMDAAEFAACLREADVVVAHAGVGTALAALENGVYPVLVPRRATRGEHVDDHQAEIAGLLAANGLASVLEVERLDAPALRRAAGRRVIPSPWGQVA